MLQAQNHQPHQPEADCSLSSISAGDVLRRFGRSFAFARYFLETPFDQRATELYALCRWIDDLADELPTSHPDGSALSKEEIQQQLQQRQLLLRNLQQQFLQPDQSLALSDGTLLNPEGLSVLLQGVLEDIQDIEQPSFRICRNREQLLNYCHCVAGSVGLLMCNILDVSNPRAFPHAVALGIAMQLTNIARDVYEDLDNQRRYIPDSLLPNLEPGTLKSGISDNELSNARVRLIQWAESYYQFGLAGIHYLPEKTQSAISIAAHVYRGIGVDLMKHVYKHPHRRFGTNLLEKISIALTVKLGITTRFHPNYSSYKKVDIPSLFTDFIDASLLRFQNFVSAKYIIQSTSLNSPNQLERGSSVSDSSNLSPLNPDDLIPRDILVEKHKVALRVPPLYATLFWRRIACSSAGTAISNSYFPTATSRYNS